MFCIVFEVDSPLQQHDGVITVGTVVEVELRVFLYCLGSADREHGVKHNHLHCIYEAGSLSVHKVCGRDQSSNAVASVKGTGAESKQREQHVVPTQACDWALREAPPTLKASPHP